MAEIHYLPAPTPAAERGAGALAWLPFETTAMAIVLMAASGSWPVAMLALVWLLIRIRS